MIFKILIKICISLFSITVEIYPFSWSSNITKDLIIKIICKTKSNCVIIEIYLIERLCKSSNSKYNHKNYSFPSNKNLLKIFIHYQFFYYKTFLNNHFLMFVHFQSLSFQLLQLQNWEEKEIKKEMNKPNCWDEKKPIHNMFVVDAIAN